MGGRKWHTADDFPVKTNGFHAFPAPYNPKWDPPFPLSPSVRSVPSSNPAAKLPAPVRRTAMGHCHPQKQSPSRKFSENHWKRGESMGCHDIAMTFWRKKTEDMEDVHSPSTASFVTRRLVCTSRSSAFAQRRKGTATFEASSTTGYSTNTLPSGKLA